jgi:hypothetical protein
LDSIVSYYWNSSNVKKCIYYNFSKYPIFNSMLDSAEETDVPQDNVVEELEPSSHINGIELGQALLMPPKQNKLHQAEKAATIGLRLRLFGDSSNRGLLWPFTNTYAPSDPDACCQVKMWSKALERAAVEEQTKMVPKVAAQRLRIGRG